MNLTDWLSPAQLAEELSRDGQHVTANWVRNQMREKHIPSVKVGNKRWFTPKCREEMERRALEAPEPDTSGYGRVTRVRRTA